MYGWGYGESTKVLFGNPFHLDIINHLMSGKKT